MSFATLVSELPSGRSRALLIDDGAYATAVLRQGAPIPWTDVAALTGHFGQTHALLDPDAVWFDVQQWQDAQLSERPALIEAMGARSRTGYAVRTLLGDDDLADDLVTAARTVAERARRPIALRVPSPAQWSAHAHAVAGTAVADVDADAADSASMYVAEWLGRLTSLPVSVVVLDAASGTPGTTVSAEELSAYTSITNVAGHLGWSVALRDGHRVETTDATSVAVIAPEFWTTGAPVPDGDVLLTSIPSTASPEAVLDKLSTLR